MTAVQVLSPAAEVSFIRNRGNFHLQVAHFSLLEDVCEVTGGAVRSTKEKEKGL